MTEKIERLKVLSDRLASLLSRPEPGIYGWVSAVGRCLDDLAALAPSQHHGGADE